jgi:hypothetical protein
MFTKNDSAMNILFSRILNKQTHMVIGTDIGNVCHK